MEDPPSWFYEGLRALQGAGFYEGLDLADYRIEDYWGMWEDRGWDEQAGAFDDSTRMTHMLAVAPEVLCDSLFLFNAEDAFRSLESIAEDDFRLQKAVTTESDAGLEIRVWANSKSCAFVLTPTEVEQITDHWHCPSALTKALAVANALVGKECFRWTALKGSEHLLLVTAHGRLSAAGTSLGLHFEAAGAEPPIDKGEAEPARKAPKAKRRLADMLDGPSLIEQLEQSAKGNITDAERKKLLKLRKPAWMPKLRTGEDVDNPNKFGGTPWLAHGEEMPFCPECDAPTFQALQLDLGTVPLKTGATGMLQVFLCDGDDRGSCFIEDSGYVIRLENGELSPRTEIASRQQAKTIVDWDTFSDDPGIHDRPDSLDYEVGQDIFDSPAEGDKLGGYGEYPQSGEPRCPRDCGKGQLVFQIESSWSGILDDVYMGDSGRLFVYVCTAHSGKTPLCTGHIEYY